MSMIYYFTANSLSIERRFLHSHLLVFYLCLYTVSCDYSSQQTVLSSLCMLKQLVNINVVPRYVFILKKKAAKKSKPNFFQSNLDNPKGQ